VYLIRNDIFLGAHDKKNDGEVYDVSKVEMHEDYNSWTGMKNDVAVVKLSRPAKLGASQGSRVKIGTQCYVTGKYWMTYGRVVSDVRLFTFRQITIAYTAGGFWRRVFSLWFVG